MANRGLEKTKWKAHQKLEKTSKKLTRSWKRQSGKLQQTQPTQRRIRLELMPNMKAFGLSIRNSQPKFRRGPGLNNTQRERQTNGSREGGPTGGASLEEKFKERQFKESSPHNATTSTMEEDPQTDAKKIHKCTQYGAYRDQCYGHSKNKDCPTIILELENQ